jgi:N-methylhydantoinase A
LAAAKESPLATVMSGPAGGVAACSYLARELAIPRALAFDMGGTSTDVCLIQDGRATVSNERRMGGYPFRLPTVAVESIGAGGGSIAWIDPAGALKVGPQSAGADPGPACYGQGGTQATVTDANMVLGYLNANGVLGGRIAVDRRLSETALAALAKHFGFGLREVAEGIVEVANSNMLRALRVVSVQKGFDLRHFTLIAFGGAGPIHAGRLAEQLGIPRVVVPALSSVFSAFGCLVADLRYDLVQTHIGRLDTMRLNEIEATFADMRASLARRLETDGYRPGEVHWRRSLDLRYVGQKYELEVPLAGTDGAVDLAQLRAEFDRLHRLSYAYATAEPVECVNARVAGVVPTGHPNLPLLRPSTRADARRGDRQAYFGELGEVATPVYDRARLVPEQRLSGPAIVEDEWSTTVVYPGHTLTVDQYGNLLMEARR